MATGGKNSVSSVTSVLYVGSQSDIRARTQKGGHCQAGAVRLVRPAVGHHEQAGAAAQTAVGGTSCRNVWLDSGLGGGVCLFDKKSSVRKENKQSGVLLLQSQRKSCY